MVRCFSLIYSSNWFKTSRSCMPSCRTVIMWYLVQVMTPTWRAYYPIWRLCTSRKGKWSCWEAHWLPLSWKISMDRPSQEWHCATSLWRESLKFQGWNPGKCIPKSPRMEHYLHLASRYHLRQELHPQPQSNCRSPNSVSPTQLSYPHPNVCVKVYGFRLKISPLALVTCFTSTPWNAQNPIANIPMTMFSPKYNSRL